MTGQSDSVPPDLTPSAIYGRWEHQVDSWEHFQDVVFELTQRHSSREMVWRGVRRADWGVMSSLYRTLLQLRGEPPLESDMILAERRTLDLARQDWRFDDRSSLELLAHLQHYGAPTRLLDVSLNPLIALWFAVEERAEDEASDSRVFAFVVGSRPIALDARWGGRDLRWHELQDDRARIAVDWGTGRKRVLWRPPAYNERISAQNGAFIIDGVPVADPHDEEELSPAEITLLRQISSLNLHLSGIERDNPRRGSAPVFTLRIAAQAKPQIREQLQRRFGYRASSIYSDLSGLAEFMRAHPEALA
jgi:FRG domain